jgi:hypothetical protein
MATSLLGVKNRNTRGPLTVAQRAVTSFCTPQAGGSLGSARTAFCRTTTTQIHRFPITTAQQQHVRLFAFLSESDIKKRLDDFQDLFVEARLCIEDVVESEGTKYFDEDAEAAQQAVDIAVQAFQNLIDDIESPDEKNRVLRGNGLKVEQLKGELALALEGGHDH